MTLTELKYIVAVAREKHFGKAAEACFVSQPTLSVAIKKLEEELDVKIFERGASEVSTTPLGEQIVRQAQQVIEQAASIREIAKRGKDPVSGPLRLGIIYTIGPYLLPDLVRQAIGWVAGTGHCFRDHVLEVCPEYARFSSDAEGIRKSFEGSSLETIKYMVAAGMGVTVVPQLSVPKDEQRDVRYIAFSPPVPTRRVVLVWRRTFPRYEAIAALRNCIYACELPGVKRLTE